MARELLAAKYGAARHRWQQVRHHPTPGYSGTHALTEQTLTDEAHFRAYLAANPYLGSWDEFAPIAYDKVPVLARAVMAHTYGLHDDSPLPYADCALCFIWRELARAAAQGRADGLTYRSAA